MQIKDWSGVIFIPLFIAMAILSSYVIMHGYTSGNIEYHSRFAMGQVIRKMDFFDYAIWGMMLIFSIWYIIGRIIALIKVIRKCG